VPSRATSVAVGATNKLITNAIGLALPDEAFLAGLIHDLGLVAIMQSQANKLLEIVQMAKAGIPFRKAEDQVLGTNHQEIGMALAAKWKFPRSFQYVTGYHHNPTDLARENRLLAMVTHVSDLLSSQKQFGITLTVENEEISAEALEEIGLTRDQLDDIHNLIEEELEIVRSLIE